MKSFINPITSRNDNNILKHTKQQKNKHVPYSCSPRHDLPQKMSAPPLEFYDVTLQCPEHQGLKGEYVVQFSSPGPFKVWGMDGLLRWEWSLPTVRRIGFQKSTAQLEVEVGRFD